MAYTFLADGKTEAGSLTYAELDREAGRIAAWLRNYLAPGDRTLLLFPSGLEFITAFYGCLYASVIAVPLYPPRRNRIDRRILAIANDAEAKFALTTSRILRDVRRRLENARELEHLTWLASDGDEVGRHRSAGVAEFSEPRPVGDTLAFFQYTSGSTATPKGVMLSHTNLVENLAGLAACWEHTPDSVMVTWLPAFHDMGLIYGMLQPVFGGFPCYFMPPAVFFQQPLLWLQAISKYRGTHSAAPNFAYDMCVERTTSEERAALDLNDWQVSLNGAEPVRESTLTSFRRTFEPCGLRATAVCPGYGLAESTLGVTAVRKNRPTRSYRLCADSLADNRVVKADDKGDQAATLVGCGPAMGRTQLLIVDPVSLRRSPANQVGEIWISGPSVAQGYWNRNEETRRTFQAHLTDTGEGPFLRTGDLGFLMDGELIVTGRIKDVIIVRGQNVYPQDIEFTVEQCHPALRKNSGAAFGVDIMGEERLVLVQEVNRSDVRSLDGDRVVGAIREAVMDHHAVPLHAVLLLRTASIPKTSSGKIQRHACRNGFLEQTLHIVAEWREEIVKSPAS